MIRPDDRAGIGARSPFTMPSEGWLAVLKRTWTETGEDNIGLIAAGIAFYMFAAIVPSLGAVVLSYGLFADADTVRSNVEAVFAAVPREAASIITEQLLTVVDSAKDKQGFGLLIAIAIAYYGATKGASAIVTGLNVAYDTSDSRGFVRTTLLNLAIVAGGVVLILLAVLATTLLGFLASLMPGAPAAVLTIVRLGGYAVLALLVVTAAAVLFRFGPDQGHPRWVWLSPGAVIATVAWLAGTSLFGLYVSNFGNYGATYGSLSAVIVLLTWLWLSAYVFLLGAELNAELERQVDGSAARNAPAGSAGPSPVQPAVQPAAQTPIAPTLPVLGTLANGALATGGFALLRRGRIAGVALVAVAALRAWRARPPAAPADGVRAVLFDIDGTLIDSNELHVTAWCQVFAEAGHDIDPATVRGQIGKGGDTMLPTLLPHLSDAERTALSDAHGRLFKRMFLRRARPFPDARRLIERVHADGRQVVLASSASGAEVAHYVRLLDIARFITATTSSDDVGTSKPAPDIFAVALDRIGVPAEAALVVGDTPYDVEAAARAGIATVAVLSGGFDRHALEHAGASALYADVAALLADYDASPLHARVVQGVTPPAATRR